MATIECKTYSRNTDICKGAYQRSAGYDLYAEEIKVVKPWGKALIRLDLLIVICESYYWADCGTFKLGNHTWYYCSRWND